MRNHSLQQDGDKPNTNDVGAGLPREDACMEGDSRHSAKKKKTIRIIRIAVSPA